jgi:hypothetical protein
MPRTLAGWLNEKRVLDYLFGENYSPELIKRARPILRFLGAMGQITVGHFDLMWNASVVCRSSLH